MVPNELDLEAIEATLCQIAEVEAARIVSSETNEIEELHVLALPDKGPKQIVRDIESTLMARFGLAIDHKKISIAQLGANKNGAMKNGLRPRLGAVQTEISDMRASVTVQLRSADDVFSGDCRGTATQAGRLRSAAEATLRAIEQWSKSDISFCLEDAVIVQLGQERVAVACVTMVVAGVETRCSGSVVVKAGDDEAVVKATLAAINRRVGI